MVNRRDFLQSLPITGAAFAVGGSLSFREPAHAQPGVLAKGHFHPKGKAPSKFTISRSRVPAARMSSAMSTELFLNFLGIRMDGRKAGGMRFTMNLITPDNGEKFLIELDNATLTNLPGFVSETPDDRGINEVPRAIGQRAR